MTVAAILIMIAAVAFTTSVTCFYAAHRAGRKPGKHRNPFPDRADETDPDGEQWIADLRDEGVWTVAVTMPSLVIESSPPVDAATLARVRAALAAPQRALTETQPIPHAVATWGMPAADVLDELARKYLKESQHVR